MLKSKYPGMDMKGAHPLSVEVVWLLFVLQKAGTQDMWMSVLKMDLDFFHLSNFYIYEK